MLPPSPCPACGKVMDAAGDPADEGRVPLPGDYSFCMYCSAFLKFGPGMELLEVPDEELDAMDDDHRKYFMRMKAVIVIAIVERGIEDLEKRSMN